MVQGMLTTNPVPSFWKIPIPIKVSGLADESICFYMRVMEGSGEGKNDLRESRYRGL